MTRWFIVLLCVYILIDTVSAQTKTLTDIERVGISDLVIVGVVEEVMDRDKHVSQNTVTAPTDIAVVRAEVILKGTTVSVIDVTNLPVASAGTKGRVYTGARLLFFLQKIRHRYKLAYAGDPCLRSVNDVEKIRTLIMQYPVTVSIQPLNASSVFDLPTSLTVKVTNNSPTPISISTIRLSGYYFAPAMELNLGSGAADAQEASYCDENNSVIIPPGATHTAKVSYIISTPASWKVYKPEQYLYTLVSLRVLVTVAQSIPRKSLIDTYQVISPSVQALIGSPPPAEPTP